MMAEPLATSARGDSVALPRDRATSQTGVSLGEDGVRALAVLRQAQADMTLTRIHQEQELSAKLVAGLNRLIWGMSAFRRSTSR